MYYLVVLFICTGFLYFLEKKEISKSNNFLIGLFPIMCLYFVLPAFQYNVGSDYTSYIWIYETTNRIELYSFLHHEYGFYYLIKVLQYFNLDSQSIFIVFGFLDTVLLFTILMMLKKYRFKLWLVFLLFFTISTIYHNQMNGLRQYIAILSTPILLILIYEKKYLKSILISLFALSFHKSFIMILMLVPILIYIKRFNPLQLFKVSLTIPFVILFIFPIFITVLVEFIFPIYKIYLISSEFNIKSILSKIYYLIFIAYFWYIYLNKKVISSIDRDIFKFMIVILSITYCSYLVDVSTPMYGRFFQYFQFFYIFPIYYIMEYNILHKNHKVSIFIVLMFLIPYLLKILVFPISEYSYQSIFFN